MDQTMDSSNDANMWLKDTLKELNIFKYIDTFQVGTLDYSDSFQKQQNGGQPFFLPMFPHLLQEKFSIRKNYDILSKQVFFQLFRQDILDLKKQNTMVQNDNIKFDKVQIKFCLMDDILHYYEEGRDKQFKWQQEAFTEWT